MHFCCGPCCDRSPEAFRPLTRLHVFILGIGVYSNAVYTKDGWTIRAIRETIMNLCPELKPNSYVTFKVLFQFQCHCTLFCQAWKWVPKYKWYFQCQPQISQANLLSWQCVWGFWDLTGFSSEYNLSNSCCSVQLAQTTYSWGLPVAISYRPMGQDPVYWTNRHSVGECVQMIACRWYNET